tara:strand:- start:1510 stop:3528 length:2019 start_codon:yes stop_codon:yes gene_type:complete
MANEDIFLGSGASITFIPEQDIYVKTSTTGTVSTITAHTDFTGNFSLIDDLYVGCLIERYNSSDELQGSSRITTNDETTITFTPSQTISANDYFVIKAYGSPVPAPKTTSGTTNTAEVTTVTFLSDDKTDYDGIYLVFTILASAGGSASTRGVWFDDTDGDSAPTTGADADSEVSIFDAGLVTKEEYAAAFTTVIDGVSNISATRSGNVVTVTNTHGGSNSSATTTSASSTISVSQATAGGSSTTTASRRLLSDQWLGILESSTFPNTEVEMKQTNLSLGGSRNYTYQYKGITSFSGGSLGLVANHGAWLYYFLGKCTQVQCSTDALVATITDRFNNADSGDNNKILIEGVDASGSSVTVGDDVTIAGVGETGPIFIRQIGNDFCPPLSPHLIGTLADVDALDRPATTSGTIGKAITYTFGEQDGDLLPSFALERNLSKLAGSSNIYRTNTGSANEDLNFTTIARGNRVNSLSLTANENEEVKMTLEVNTRNVHNLSQTVAYDARRGVEDEKTFFNFDTTNNSDDMREPFFFSDGTFKVLGHTFLKINTLTLNMNNNLQDRRFLGVGAKNVQEAIPAQRTYEIQFTGHVTDDRLYQALLDDAEKGADQADQTIELIFTKSNGETITLNFTDYFVSANNFPIPDDKGPIVVEATVMPRNLSLCTVKTHWVLQG